MTEHYAQRPTLVKVEFISAEKAVVTAQYGDAVMKQLVSYEQGMQIAHELQSGR